MRCSEKLKLDCRSNRSITSTAPVRASTKSSEEQYYKIAHMIIEFMFQKIETITVVL